MKTILKFRFLLMILLVGSFMACKKNDSPPEKLSTTAMAQRLYTQKDFVDFTGSFAKNFKYLTDYYQTPAILSNEEVFVSRLKSAGEDHTALENVHNSYGLNLLEIQYRKANLENDVLKLFHSQPALLEYNEEEFWSIVKQSVLLMKQSSANSLIRSNASGITGKAIVVDEIWDCLVRATGLGAASIISIAALHALAKKGIQEIVVTASAFMAKRAGFIGLAIMVLDFSSCMYRASYS